MQVLKPILIGQAPSPNDKSAEPRASRFGPRLAELACVPVLPFIASFERISVLNFFPDKPRARGDFFPVGPARAAARAVVPSLAGHAVVLVGARVAIAFGALVPWLTTGSLIEGTSEVLVVPHPSNVVTWWHDPVHVEMYRKSMQAFLRRHAPPPLQRRMRIG